MGLCVFFAFRFFSTLVELVSPDTWKPQSVTRTSAAKPRRLPQIHARLNYSGRGPKGEARDLRVHRMIPEGSKLLREARIQVTKGYNVKSARAEWRIFVSMGR